MSQLILTSKPDWNEICLRTDPDFPAEKNVRGTIRFLIKTHFWVVLPGRQEFKYMERNVLVPYSTYLEAFTRWNSTPEGKLRNLVPEKPGSLNRYSREEFRVIGVASAKFENVYE